MKKICLLPLIFMLGLSGCKNNEQNNQKTDEPTTGGETGGDTDNTKIHVNSVLLDINECELRVEETFTLNYRIIPNDADDKSVSWSSTNNSIATVNNGVVTALSEGNCDIVITTKDGNKTDKCALTVKDKAKHVESILLDNANMVLDIGDASYIGYTVLPSYIEDKEVSFFSSNENVATVNNEGLVTAVSAGSADITLTAHENGLTNVVKVNVKEEYEPINVPDIINPTGLETVYSLFDPTSSNENASDLVKNNLMWDTNTLFAKTVQPEFLAYKVDGLDCFLIAGEDYKNLPTKFFGAIGYPDSSIYPMPQGGYPAVMLIHGGGGYVFTDWIKYWTNKGFVAVAIDMFGNKLDQSGNKATNPAGGPGEKDGCIYDNPTDEKNSWTYHSVNNVILTNNYLRSLSNVNEKQIGIVGISWGSVITEIISGVDKRFASYVITYGSGYLYEDSFWNKDGATFKDPNKKQAWIEKFDPSSYIGYSCKPVMFVSGFNDNCFCANNRIKTAKLLEGRGKVYYSTRSDLLHGNTWNQTYEIYAFFLHTLLGMDTLSDIGTTSNLVYYNQNAPRLTFTYANAKFDKVLLIYTTSTDTDSHKWSFNTQLVSYKNGYATMPEGVTAYCFEFISRTIDSNYHLSTPIFVLD